MGGVTGVLGPLFTGGSLLGLAGVVGRAALLRGRFFAIFASVLLGIHLLVTLSLFSYMGPLQPLAVYLQAAAIGHLFLLSSPRMRPLWFRALVSIPGSFFVAGAFLALPWAIAALIGLPPYGWWLPWLVAAFGTYQSLTRKKESVPLVVDTDHVGALLRLPRAPAPAGTPLRVVQITDPHLGPFMSVAQLKGIAQRAVEANPDLILLTGDFLTMESSHTPGALAAALAPLKAAPGKCFACFGNHDHEAPEEVMRGLAENGVTLLVDAAQEVMTPIGRVQILGADFVWKERAAHLKALCAAHPRDPGVFRILLLHDPGAFGHVPEGEGDLVLSGHTHGGQVGLLSLGSTYTFLSLFRDLPDHGWWGKGQNRLYVHRGTGHYGFPLRVGVPGEESVLEIYPPNAPGVA